MKNVIYIYVYHLTYIYPFLSTLCLKGKDSEKNGLGVIVTSLWLFFSYLGNYSNFLRKYKLVYLIKGDVNFYLE